MNIDAEKNIQAIVKVLETIRASQRISSEEKSRAESETNDIIRLYKIIEGNRRLKGSGQL